MKCEHRPTDSCDQSCADEFYRASEVLNRHSIDEDTALVEIDRSHNNETGEELTMPSRQEEIRGKIYSLVKEVHIQKPFEDVSGEPHYVTDQIMKIVTSLTEAHKQHEHEMYEELEKAHREEMERFVGGILETIDNVGYVHADTLENSPLNKEEKQWHSGCIDVCEHLSEEIAKKFNIEVK